MNNVKVNGTQAIESGSFLVPPGCSVSVPMGGRDMTLVFDPSEPGYKWDHWTLTVNALEAPLGFGFSADFKTSDGRDAKLAMTVKTIGAAPTPIYREVSYLMYIA